jgi:hypothetical protein
MKLKVLLAGLTLIALGAGSALAEDKPAAAAAGMDEAEMMKKWMEIATPGEPHKMLEQLTGVWDTTLKSWMDPSAPPTESKGVTRSEMVLGGRYLHQTFEGTFMDQPFHGLGYTGYDNYKKQYIGVWMDTMSTTMMASTGTADASGKKLSFTGSMDDFMTGKVCEFKEVLTVVDADHHSFEMWAPAPSGEVFKNMEIHYTRKK